MPVFRVTSPEGAAYDVTAPDGATEQDALAVAQAHHSALAQLSPAAANNSRDTQITSAAAQPVQHTGYAAQVARTMSGSGPTTAPSANLGIGGPPESVDWATLAHQYKDLSVGVAEGAPSGVAGTPGDLEKVIRLPLAAAGLASRQSWLPGSDQVADSIFGAPASPEQAAGRMIGIVGLSPPALEATLRLAAAGAPVIAHTLGAMTGTGPVPIQEAYRAGTKNGQVAQEFLSALRGSAPTGNRPDSTEDLWTPAPVAAGQALNSAIARGDAKIRDTGIILGSALAGHPAALAALPFTSPRLVGEAAYLTGRVAPYANQALAAAGNAALLGVPGITKSPLLSALLAGRLLSVAAQPFADAP